MIRRIGGNLLILFLAFAMMPLYVALHLCRRVRAADELIEWWKASIFGDPDAMMRRLLFKALRDGEAFVELNHKDVYK